VADGTCSFQQKTIRVLIDGAPAPGGGCDDRGGTPCPASFTFSVDTNCQGTGPHDIHVETSCATTDPPNTFCFTAYNSADTTYATNNQPGVSLSVTAPDRDGHTHAEATGSFPHHQGWVEMSWDGGGLGYFLRGSTNTDYSMTLTRDFIFDCGYPDGMHTFDAASWVCFGGPGADAHAPQKTTSARATASSPIPSTAAPSRR
jgi:hypothetical protein